MRLGVPKEIKVHEYRVGMTPASVREVVEHGHSVILQAEAGAAIDFDDDSYRAAGASVVDSAEEVFASADMIVKVKGPQPEEIALLRPDQTLFTYLHLAPDAAQTKGLIDSGCIAIAYETVTDQRGGLPLLAPMSEVAGRLSVQVGAHCLEMEPGGRGVLLGGVPGVPSGKVVVIGGGVVGANAARMAVGLECDVVIIDRSIQRLAELDEMFHGRINTIYSTRGNIEEQVISADLVIGAVLVPGAGAPHLVTAAMVEKMNRGSVIVDVAIDQGGCCETSHTTTHAEPTYKVNGVVHYCVANMPGGVARTSTLALNNATLAFVLDLADKGWRQAMLDDAHLRAGLNVHAGRLTHEAVARDQNLAYVSPEDALGA
jgi:alanine dehydrogenase